jgi:hypothetical protein
MKAELPDRTEVTAALETTMIAIRNIVEGFTLSEQDKRDLLNNIATWPLVVEKIVIQRRSKAPNDRREGQKARKLFASGTPLQEVAHLLGVSIPTLYRRVPASSRM